MSSNKFVFNSALNYISCFITNLRYSVWEAKRFSKYITEENMEKRRYSIF